jgi:hypothetical protein
VARFSLFSQSLTRPATSNVLLQQLSPPSVVRAPDNLILIDGVVGPVQQGNVSGAFIAYTWKFDNVFNQSVQAKSAQTITDALSVAPILRNACVTGRRLSRVRFIFSQYSPTLVQIYTMSYVTISQIDEIYWGKAIPYLEVTFNFTSIASAIQQK